VGKPWPEKAHPRTAASPKRQMVYQWRWTDQRMAPTQQGEGSRQWRPWPWRSAPAGWSDLLDWGMIICEAHTYWMAADPAFPSLLRADADFQSDAGNPSPTRTLPSSRVTVRVLRSARDFIPPTYCVLILLGTY